ncbi:GNAT family N-acetyltransferase [Candidatus Poribacteria bacterium]
MLEIKAFKEEYIDDAARLFAASYERERVQLPIIPERKNIIDEVSEALLKIAGKPGVAAFRSEELVGYILETDTAENFMSKRTAFCIGLYPHCAIEQDKEHIYQKMYERLSRIWVRNGYHTHEISIFAGDNVLSFALYRLGFGMTHFQLFRDLSLPEGEFADVTIKKLDSAESIQELNMEHYHYYPNPPLFWIPHGEDDEDREDRILSGDREVLAAFDGDQPVAIFSLRKGGAEAWLLADEENGRITGAYAKEEYRGKGIGKALLRKVVEWACENGCSRLYVEGESANIYGGNFWIKHFIPVVFSVRRCIDERITIE